MMWIALVYIGLLLLFLLATESWPLHACWRPFVERRLSVCNAWREHRLFLSGVFFFLTWFALPIGLIFDWLKDPIERKFRKPGTQNFIDVWHFLFLGASLAVLYLHPTPLLAMVPLLKLADLFQTLLEYMIKNREAPKSPRPILHLLLIHYPQVIVTFAVIFVERVSKIGSASHQVLMCEAG